MAPCQMLTQRPYDKETFLPMAHTAVPSSGRNCDCQSTVPDELEYLGSRGSLPLWQEYQHSSQTPSCHSKYMSLLRYVLATWTRLTRSLSVDCSGRLTNVRSWWIPTLDCTSNPPHGIRVGMN
jgi:hypothetical protein